MLIHKERLKAKENCQSTRAVIVLIKGEFKKEAFQCPLVTKW